MWYENHGIRIQPTPVFGTVLHSLISIWRLSEFLSSRFEGGAVEILRPDTRRYDLNIGLPARDVRNAYMHICDGSPFFPHRATTVIVSWFAGSTYRNYNKWCTYLLNWKIHILRDFITGKCKKHQSKLNFDTYLKSDTEHGAGAFYICIILPS
jgi:hypothetical protein